MTGMFEAYPVDELRRQDGDGDPVVLRWSREGLFRIAWRAKTRTLARTAPDHGGRINYHGVILKANGRKGNSS